MSLSKKALDALQNHWAVNAIGAADLTARQEACERTSGSTGCWRTDCLFILLEREHTTRCWSGLRLVV